MKKRLRTEHRKMTVSSLRSLAKELGVSVQGLLKDNIVEAVIEYLYKPPPLKSSAKSCRSLFQESQKRKIDL